MYPKLIYQSQSLFLKNKDNFRDIKMLIYDDLVQLENFGDIDSLFNSLIVKDVSYVANKFDIVLDYESNQPELFFVFSLISYIIGANHLIGGLQGNDLNTKIYLAEHIENINEINLPASYIFIHLKNKYRSHYLFDSYIEFITQLSHLVASNDQQVSSKEIKVINLITTELSNGTFGTLNESQPNSQINSNSIKLSKSDIDTTSENKLLTIEEILKELETFTGMNEIKQDIYTLINFIKIQKQREKHGLSTVTPSLHMVFTGPPGTGKTTIARIMGKIFKALGVLDQGHLVETDRAGLVAGYTGQTAIKVDEVVKSAIGGVLFIDEAYSLSTLDSEDSFGQEAIDTLLKRMEDNRDKLVIIVAGYAEEMERFIDSNPGFKSRFNKYIGFEDYKPNELISIFDSIVKKNNYLYNNALKEKLNILFQDLYKNRTKSFGNARVVRNIFEKIVENQSNRLVSGKVVLTSEELKYLIAEDLIIN